MPSQITGAAIIASAFAVAGFLVGWFYSALASTLPDGTHVQVLANESYIIGGISLIIALALWILIIKNDLL